MNRQTPQWLDILEYPFKNCYFKHNGHQFHYIDEGKGENLLFVHGTPSWSFDFRHLIKSLSNKYRCIAIDHLGFGLSDKPKNGNYSINEHTNNLKALIHHLQLSEITLIVHDFGGPIAFHYALENPHHIKRLIAFNTWMWSAENDDNYKKMKRILKNPILPFLYRQFNFSARYLLPKSFGKKPLNKKLMNQYTSPFASKHERDGTIGFLQSLLNDQKWFESLWQKRDILNAIPKLFIWGLKDNFISSTYLDKFIEVWPNSECLKLETCGHFPQEEEPELSLNAIREFLESTSD